jgi:hypothetical protein
MSIPGEGAISAYLGNLRVFGMGCLQGRHCMLRVGLEETVFDSQLFSFTTTLFISYMFYSCMFLLVWLR